MRGEDVDLLSEIVVALGTYAERLIEAHPLGLENGAFHGFINSVYDMVRELKTTPVIVPSASFALRPPNVPDPGVWDDGNSWNYLQTLRFATGTMMLSEKYRKYMTRDNLRRALLAKVLHKCQIGILDDIIDEGDYTYLEAKDIHHLVLSSMVDPHFDENVFVKHLVELMKQDQIPLFELVTRIAKHFNRLWRRSPRGAEYFYWMEQLDERVALGQGLTMFQKEARLDLEEMRSIGSSFFAPSNDVTWWEKIAAHVSSSTRYNFIDMAFSDSEFDLNRLSGFLTGWYYYDAAILLMDHVSSVSSDLRNGIANLSLVAMREEEILGRTTLRGYDPELTADDYDEHLSRIAALSCRGLERVHRDFPEEDSYYAVLTVMMPVVMMADWIGGHDDMIDRYVRSIAPAVRRCAMGALPPTVEVSFALPRLARTRPR